MEPAARTNRGGTHEILPPRRQARKRSAPCVRAAPAARSRVRLALAIVSGARNLVCRAVRAVTIYARLAPASMRAGVLRALRGPCGRHTRCQCSLARDALRAARYSGHACVRLATEITRWKALRAVLGDTVRSPCPSYLRLAMMSGGQVARCTPRTRPPRSRP